MLRVVNKTTNKSLFLKITVTGNVLEAMENRKDQHSSIDVTY